MSLKRIHELIAEHCPDGVQRRPLGEVVHILDSQRKPISKDKRESGAIPYYGANGVQGYVKNYIFDGTFLLFGEDGSVINKDYSPVLHWATGQIWVNNHAHVLAEKAEVALLRFIFYALSACDVSGIVRGVPPKINQASLRNIEIPLPPLAVQLEIVRILDALTSLQAELQAELAARRSQLEFYRDSLLSFNNASTPPWRWMKLSEVGHFVRGNGIQKSDFVVSGVGCIHYGQIFTHYGTSANRTKSFVSTEKASKSRSASTGDLVIATTSENITDVCKAVAWLGEETIAISGDSFVFKHSLDPLFVAFFFQSTFFQRQKERIVYGTKVMRVSRENLEKIEIPVPPASVQKEIAEALIKFDVLLNDPSIGLPAEIEARRQQFEFYRNQLLSFKEVAA